MAQSAEAKRIEYAWTPQPGPQLNAICADWCDELFFGGARGGGKSDFLLGDFLQGVDEYREHWQGIVFRRTVPELQQLIKRSHQIFPQTGAEWKEGKKEWHWGCGARLLMRHLDRSRDAAHYQGHEYCFVGWDELGQWATSEAYDMLRACLRYSAADIPKKRIRATGNPGGPGHHWIKQYFIDFAPNGCEPFDDPVTGMCRMFIRSRVEDNRILLERDPGYIARLKGVGSEQLVRAWLEGDWSAVTGAYFGEISDAHIIRPFAIPQHWTRIRSFDWGSARPFSCGWWAISSGQDDKHNPHEIQRGAVVRYREWYGCASDKPNTGLKMRAEDVAAGILARSFDEDYALSVADPAIFKEDGGPSIAETMRLHGVYWRPADNERLPGWQQLRARLIGNPEGPLLYVFDTCRDWIRTMPALQHDEHKPEDIDTDGEDHIADETRYFCMARPIVSDPEHEKVMQDPLKQTAGKLLKAHFSRRR